MLRAGSRCVSFPSLQGERRSTSIHQDLFSTPDLLFAYLSEKNQSSLAYLETSGGLPTTACYTNTSNYEVPCYKMTSFSKCSLSLASHSSKVHLCPNISFSVSQTATSAAVVWRISPVLLAWKQTNNKNPTMSQKHHPLLLLRQKKNWIS